MRKILFTLFTALSFMLPFHSTSLGQSEKGQFEVYPGGVLIRSNYLNCGDFLAFSESDKATYIAGIVDGFFGAMLFGADDKYIGWLDQYAKGKSNRQLNAIVTQYIKENPSIWHQQVQYGVFSALYRAYLSK